MKAGDKVDRNIATGRKADKIWAQIQDDGRSRYKGTEAELERTIRVPLA